MSSETIPARVNTRFCGGMSSTDQVDVRGPRLERERTVEGEVRFGCRRGSRV